MAYVIPTRRRELISANTNTELQGHLASALHRLCTLPSEQIKHAKFDCRRRFVLKHKLAIRVCNGFIRRTSVRFLTTIIIRVSLRLQFWAATNFHPYNRVLVFIDNPPLHRNRRSLRIKQHLKPSASAVSGIHAIAIHVRIKYILPVNRIIQFTFTFHNRHVILVTRKTIPPFRQIESLFPFQVVSICLAILNISDRHIRINTFLPFPYLVK